MKTVVTRNTVLLRRRPGQVPVRMVPFDKLCLADPGVQIVLPGDEVTFRNKTNGEMILFFPRLELFKELKKLGNLVRIRRRGHLSLHVARRGLKPHDVFEYAMYCGAMKTFALGGSNPEFIIGP